MNNKELCEKYPFLIPRDIWTDEISKDYDYSYIRGDYELPIGWKKLFLQMCEDIRQPLIDANYLDEFRFSQIKEKYNTMRCYNFGAPEAVHDIISKYEYVSQFICQKCGQPATHITNGWIASYCDECWNAIGFNMDMDENNWDYIDFEPVMHIQGYKNGEKYDKYIDCSDIWRRLYDSEP